MGDEADSSKLIAHRKYKNYSPQLTALSYQLIIWEVSWKNSQNL